ncbi:hypothetical protein A1O7_08691 [Cladophialophora yegresii CBS 114405]|uniref:Uncharacterized protein n=1 Tax=Cladophialophora yegresii CBS 114405 TaxID=1182544 RepID=W9VUB1_9EURO|nr:uncharacterized protein A1O7_08691 [Cladophialophora yegresii CBS 114405]EXJ55761.1 hypothetical protein A1O7_08691 [Cladophialophora yegresii CBS 114405]
MYWKASYQKAESERLSLLNELTQLKQERDLALQPHQDAQHSKGKTTTRKRKRDTSAHITNQKNKSHHDLDPYLECDDINLDFSNLNTPSTVC